jgi:hypothetical protein
MVWKLIPIVIVASLAACASPTSRQVSSDTSATDTTTAGGTSSGAASYPSSGKPMCDAQPIQNLIGQKLTPALTEQARVGATSNKTRVLKPGEVMTMEYNPERLNLILDQQGALTALRCG